MYLSICKTLISNTTALVCSHSVNNMVVCNNDFLRNNFPINPAILSLSP